MFIENGFFETQMKDVAVAVGVSRNSLYRYFHDKGDLGYAVLEIVYGRLESHLEQIPGSAGLNGRERLHQMLEHFFLSKALREEFTFMAEFDSYFSGNRIPDDFHSRAGGHLSVSIGSRIGDLVTAGVKDGSIRQDIKPKELIPMVIYSVKALLEHVLLRRSAMLGLSSKGADSLLPHLVTVLIDGLKPSPHE
jgi:AcrR family transcriptional regulator